MDALVQKIINLINWTVNWFFAIVLLLSVLGLLYGAFLFLTAGGDTTKLGKAKQWVLWPLVGFAVAILAKTFLRMICTFFNVNCAGLGIF